MAVNNPFNQRISSIWQSSAPGLAIVSGVYSLIVIALLFGGYLSEQSGLPEKERIYSTQLAAAMSQLIENPTNQELKQEIRRYDLAMRQGFFEQRAFVERGKWLLLVGVVVFLISLKKTMAMRRFKAKRRQKNKDPEREAIRLFQARKAIGVTGLVMSGAVLALALTPTIELPAPEEQVAAEPAGPDYASDEELKQNWPMFRGPYGQGTAYVETVPQSWDGESGEGILWKAEVPLPGANSPIVWGDRVFLAGADEESKALFCFHATTGELLWRGDIGMAPGADPSEELRIYEGTGWAAPTMATDGRRIYVIVADGTLAAFDMNGERVWAKSMGTPDSVYSFATSLLCYQDRLILQFDQGYPEDGISTLFAFDGATGQTVWQTPRPVGSAWTSPILIEHEGQSQIITCSEPLVIGYDADSGEELWSAELMGYDLAPSPAYTAGRVIVVKPNEKLFAIDPSARGDITESGVYWGVNSFAPDVASPAAKDGLIFLQTTMGIMVCHDAETGDELWDHDFDDSFQPSPIAIGDWIYTFSETGQMYRVKAGRELETPEKLGFIDDWFRATPAFVEGRIYLRGDGTLYCVGSE